MKVTTATAVCLLGHIAIALGSTVTNVLQKVEFNGATVTRTTEYKVQGGDSDSSVPLEFSSAADNIFIHHKNDRSALQHEVVERSGNRTTYRVYANPKKVSKGGTVFVVETKDGYEINPVDKNLPQITDKIKYTWEGDLCDLINDVESVMNPELKNVLVNHRIVNGRLISFDAPTAFPKAQGSVGSLSMVSNKDVQKALDYCKTHPGIASLRYDTSEVAGLIKTLDRDLAINALLNKIHITEKIDLRTGAPALRDQFSRINDMRANFMKVPSPMHVRSLEVTLPADASAIRYYDKTGAVSTFSVNNIPKRKVIVDLQPRYPVIGDWKYEFELSYTVPASNFLQKDQDTGGYILTMPPVEFPSNVAVQSDETTIRLPPFSKNVELIDTLHKFNSTLDTECVSNRMFLHAGCQQAVKLSGKLSTLNNLKIEFHANPLFQLSGLVNIAVFILLTFVSVKVLSRLLK